MSGDNNNKKENVFIGARALSDNQVNLIVPTFESILFQIEEIRKQAEAEKQGEKNRQYNNTIGLFGARGTGKTSSLYTLIKKLQQNERYNIILPIIEPDNFGENSKILGAILGVLKKEVEEIQKELKDANSDKYEMNEFFSECKFKENNLLNQKYNDVLEYYCYTEQEYRKLLTQNFTDKETYKKNYSYILNPDLEFGNKLKEFINKLIEVKKDINRKIHKDKSKQEPLIFLFIDDVDLKTSKCKELIESVMQYTCHPNVVCILSGDYEILKESITLSLLENEKLAQDNLNEINKIFDDGMDMIERKKYLSNEYLKKILPPAFRHNVVRWNLSNIPKFSFEQVTKEDEYNNKSIYLYEKLNEVFGENNIFCFKIYSEENNTDNIRLIKSSYNIFDTTPRGLVNVYYYLSKYDEKKFKNKEERNKREENLWFVYVKSLVDTLISSSSFLAPYQDKFFKNYLIWGSGEDTTVVDFIKIGEKILEWDEKHKSEENKKIISEKENKNPEKKLRKHLSFFLVGYCVKKLLPNVSCRGYYESKEKFMYAMYSNPWFSDRDIKAKDFIAWDKFKGHYKGELYFERNRYNAAICDLLKYTDLEFGLSFYEDLIERLNNENIYIEENENLQHYSEQAFLSIYNILFSNEEKALDVVKQWYRLGYEENGKMKNGIELLDKMARQSKGYENTVKIFKSLRIKVENIKIVKYSEQEIYLMQLPERRLANNREILFEDLYDTCIKDLLVKNLISIAEDKQKIYENFNEKQFLKLNLENIEESTKNQLLKRKKLAKLYHIIKKVNSDTEKNYNKEKVAKYIDTQITKLGQILSEQIVNMIQKENAGGIKYSKIKEEINKFVDFVNIERTVHNRTQRYIMTALDEKNYIDEINIEQYIKIINKLNYLAYRTNAWYGVIEARNLLNYIKENAELVLGDEFDNQIAPILYEYSKYRKNNDEIIIEKGNLENKKIKMKKVLYEAFKEIREEEKIDLEDIGLELEDTEEDIE